MSDFNWLQMLADGDVTFPTPAKAHQIHRTLLLLRDRAMLPDVVERAAIVLMSRPWAPEHECILGGKVTAASGKVKCGECRRRWDASPWEPLLNGDGNTPVPTGTCVACFVAVSRPDDQVPVLTGKVVGKRKTAEVAS